MEICGTVLSLLTETLLANVFNGMDMGFPTEQTGETLVLAGHVQSEFCDAVVTSSTFKGSFFISFDVAFKESSHNIMPQLSLWFLLKVPKCSNLQVRAHSFSVP